MKTQLACLLSAGIVLSAPALRAADFCVATSAQLEFALAAAASNGSDDTLRLVATTFVVPVAQYFTYSPPANVRDDLTLQGGYDAGCLARAKGAKSTIDASATPQATALYLDARDGSVIHVSDLAFVGLGTTGLPLPRTALLIEGSDSTLVLDGNAFQANASTAVPAVDIVVPGGSIALTDNVFAGNSAGAGPNAGTARLGGDPVEAAPLCIVENNTFIDNVASGAGDAGPTLRNCEQALFASNLSWNNSGAGALFQTELAAMDVALRFNDLGAAYKTSGNVQVSETGTISAAPLFGDTSLAPAVGSPLVDSGDPAFALAGNPLDHWGNPRLEGLRVDIGAVESSPRVFRDGFE